MTVMDYASYQRPQRRAVGAALAPAPPAKAPSQMPPQPQQHAGAQQSQVLPTHYHSRTASSAIFSPAAPHPAAPTHAEREPSAMPGTMVSNRGHYNQPQSGQQQQQSYADHPSRRLTNSTISSIESNPRTTAPPHAPPPIPQSSASHNPQQGYLAAGAGQPQTLPYRNASRSSSNTNLRRSTSSRSQASSLGPSSYVALLRKQKATVWCERTQHTDPRVTAQARLAKQRAAREIAFQNRGRNSVAIASANASSSGGMLGGRKKAAIKVGGAGTSTGQNLAAGPNVPERLSTTEVSDEEDDEGDAISGFHRRTNSGKSSLRSAGQGARLSAPRTNTRLSYGSGGGASSGKPGSSAGQTPPGEYPPGHVMEHRGSTGSADSEERREKEMGEVGDMQAPIAAETQESKRQAADLSRRGSVDERAATMRGAAGAMRLFVANPDADDSD